MSCKSFERPSSEPRGGMPRPAGPKVLCFVKVPKALNVLYCSLNDVSLSGGKRPAWLGGKRREVNPEAYLFGPVES